jgi:cell division protease FtsH
MTPASEPGPPSKDREKKPLSGFEPNWRYLIWYVPLALVLLWLWQDMAYQAMVRTIPYSEFKASLRKGEVIECQVKEDEIVGRIEAKTADNGDADGETGTPPTSVRTDKYKSAKPPAAPVADVANTDTDRAPLTQPESDEEAEEFLFRTVRVEDPNLVQDLEEAKVRFVGVRPSILSQFLLYWALPLGLMVLLWVFLSRGLASAGSAVMSFGRSKAKLVADKETGVRFDDVAGCDEAKYELQEVVDFLRTPARYVALGAKIPKGVLLCGPPGTGKTLLARAVAGEAGVPFFSISGSDFVEMFVGVGAARVRDLFDQGKRHAPCIIFIDELDAIGRQRGVHVGTANDEREQTLNQLLVELDGFEPNAGVIILAATNRPEVLDRALLRPGRLDRQVIVDAPDLDGRKAILKVHSREKPLAEDVNLRKIAQGTPGFSGADLANAVNEAALLAARRKSEIITQKDLEEAVEKVVAGPERKSRRLSEEERRRVAYHEVGHALVATYSKHADPVHKISIVPRGRAALGYTLQLPTDEQFLLTRSEIEDRIKGLLGGRAAEDVVFGEVSSGAENDLERATAMARQMVAMYGMSETVGLVHCARRDGLFLSQPDGALQRDCSEQTVHAIDQEVKKLLGDAYGNAKSILTERRDRLDSVSEELLKRETLDAAAFRQLLDR